MLSPLVVATTAGPAAADDAAPEVVLSTDFSNASWQDAWQQSGGPTLTVVDDDGNHVLEVANRAADYEGIESKPAAVTFESEVTYTFSLRARLADDVAHPLGARFVFKPGYAWIGNTQLSDEWTTVTGTFTVPAGTDPSAAAVYFGTENLDPSGEEGDNGEPYTYYVDDILITRPATGPATVLSTDFEDGETAPWIPRGPATLTIAAEGHDSDSSMLVSSRADGWHGPQLPVGALVTEGTYEISGWVKLPAGTEGTAEINFGMQQPGASNEYPWVGGRLEVGADEWVHLAGTYTVDPATPPTNLYVESASPTVEFLVDDVVILGPPADAWTPEDDPDFVPGGAVGATASPITAARGSGDVAALTFDDGPNGETTEHLLDVLAANDVTATFCVIGQNVTAPGGAEVLQRIVAEGHTLCNHSTSYADMGAMTHAQVEADLKANLEIIRDALGDPTAQVPYFRAPNGSFGVTGEVAAALGMQPLGLGNMIADWDNPQPSVATLEANLRAAVQPGAVVLVHDGGGDRTNGVTAVENVLPELLADGWTFTLPRGGAPVGAYSKSFDFEDGTLQGWVPREVAEGAATVAVTDVEAHEGTYAAAVSDRVHQGQGIGYPVSDEFQAGVTYDISAWLKFAYGETPGNIWLSIAQTVAESTTYGTVAQFSGLSASGWVEVTAALTMPSVDEALLYFETAYASGEAGNTSTFLVDDVTFSARVPGDVQDLTPLKDTVAFPVGVAIDSRETLGAPADLLLKHFGQVSAENHMKVESFYEGEWNFRVHPQAYEILDFAQENDLRVYGHVLAWHSQTPEWFFQDDDGVLLTDSEDDKAIMRDRLETHVRNVAEAFADEYGPYGSETNPFVAWDVVNEVVDDSTQYSDGLRRSHWYSILGEEYIHLAFEYADRYFNDVFAAEGSDRPIKLFINDYNTEQSGKQDRYFALVQRMLDAGTPVDGVGHQFHVNLAMPTANLAGALERFSGLGLRQAVTELDVTVMADTPAQIVEQGHYYQRAFDIFRDHADELESVTVWGLTDGRSWRSTGKPLLFDDELQAKPAYYGAAGSDDLAPLIRAADVFRADVDADGWPPSHNEWRKLRLHDIGTVGGFQLRWAPSGLTAYVEVEDATPGAGDVITFEYDGRTATFARDGSGSLEGTVAERTSGYAAVVELPFVTTLAQGGTTSFDVRVSDGATTSGWNSPGELGVLSLVEDLSYVQVLPAPAVPEVDGVVDAAWSGATSVTTEKVTSGDDGATAQVRTLWRDGMLYVLAEVTDPVVDVTGSDPWTQDSVEIYVDAGNFKAGGYRYDDTQIRISAQNAVSFGTGDEAFQANRLVSATAPTATGYVVEAAISLLEEGGAGTFHGVDFQVNDASAGARTSIANWADPTGTGYQSTARWGVAKLVAQLEDDGPVTVDPGPGPGPDPVDVAPVVTEQPVNVTAAKATKVTLRAAASGTPVPTVQWERRAPGASTWSAVPGATSTSLTVKNTKGRSGSAYRAVFTNRAGAATSRAAVVRVEPVKARVTVHPKSVTKARPGKRIVLRAKAKGGFPKASVQWQQRKPGGTWSKVRGATKRKLVVVASHKTHQVRYRAVFSNEAGTVRTKAARVTVRTGRPVFVTQPKHARVRAGKAATFTAVVAARHKARFQWYTKAPGSSSWVAVAGAKRATLTVRPASVRHGAKYRLVASNAKGRAVSKVVRITVKR